MEKEYIFILGRNPELSKQEVFSYLIKNKNKILESELKSHALYIKISEGIEKNAIKKLGGVISISKVLSKGNKKEVIKSLENQELHDMDKKLSYCVWNFSNNEAYDEIIQYLKNRFKSEKIKATFRPLHEKMKLQTGEEVGILSSKKLIDEHYCLFEKSKGEILFSKVIQKPDYGKIEERDMSKPVRRSELSIPPRLSKIMINLSEVREGEKLLDTFCGIGSLLQEALLQEINVIGIDNDSKAIQGARKNLSYAGFSKKDYELINEDSRKVNLSKEKIKNLKGLATEPDLGETLKKVPTEKEAGKTLRNFENLIISVIKNFKEDVKGKIVFSSPLIKTHAGRVSVNKNTIEKGTGLKIKKDFPIKDFRENKIVGREIFVLGA